MATQITGPLAAIAQVEIETQALRTTLRPTDPGALGQYAKALTSGIIGAGIGAAAPVFSFRYGGANVCLVKRITVSIAVSTAFASGFFSLGAWVARAFSASDSGQTAGTLTLNNGKLRTTFGVTGVSDIRIANTAAITPGTRILDTDAFATASLTALPATATSLALAPFDLWRPMPGEQPQVFTNLNGGEGFVIQATVPATGIWQLGVAVTWDEVAAW